MNKNEFLTPALQCFSEAEMYEKRREPRLNFNGQYDYSANRQATNIRKCWHIMETSQDSNEWGATLQLAKMSIDAIRLQYSAGDNLDHLRAFYPATLWAWEEHVRHLDNWHDSQNFIDSFSNRVPAISFSSDHNYGLIALPMLCFGLLLGHADLMPRLCACWDYINDELDFHDKLIETLVTPFVPGRQKKAEDYTRHLPYRKLDKVFKATPDKRPALMAKYLDEWYHASRREPYHDMHEDMNFDGYWAYEAAAVTYVFDIDDASYRDMDFYPRDLVDYARQHFPRAHIKTPGLYAMTGESCPRTGLWSPRADVPLHDHPVTEGQPMPMAEWRDSQGNFHQQAIKWQWVKAL